MRVLAVLLTTCLLATSTRAQYGGGSGTTDDPYQIWTAEQMNAVGTEPNDWDRHFILMDDVDLSAYTGRRFNIIGSEAKAFSGVFDGNGKRILHFDYTCEDANDIGFFGHVFGTGTEIRNLGLVDPNVRVTAGYRTGALVGYLRRGGLVNCYAEGGRVAGDVSVGGLVGRNRLSSGRGESYTPQGISGCYSTCDVSGTNQVGGLVGNNNYRVMNCYATGSVSGLESVGGLIGRDDGYTLAACYAAGSVSGTDPNVGGLVGSGHGLAVMSYWDREASGQASSAAGKGKTTAQMQRAETFIGWGACGYDGIWTIDEAQDYPRLRWENRPGQVIGLVALSDFLDGTGEPNDPYLIHTPEELNRVGLFPCEWAKSFQLVADIDLGDYTGDQFNVIGDASTSFSGTFAGGGHVIANFRYHSRNTQSAGLFGSVLDSKAEIRDLGLIDPNVSVPGGSRVGSLVGSLIRGTVRNCHAQGACVTGEEAIGGLIGYSRGSIVDCHAGAAVTGGENVGGLVGHSSGKIERCGAEGVVSGRQCVGGLAGLSSSWIRDSHATATTAGQRYVGGLTGRLLWYAVTGSYASGAVSGADEVGGLVGENVSGTIETSYATGAVNGSTDAGGLVGENLWGTLINCYASGGVNAATNVGGLAGSSDGAITTCYSTGQVAGDQRVGGLVGDNDGDVTISYWDKETSGRATNSAGQGRTTAQMQQADTFRLWGACDNAGVWTLDEGRDYPRLAWEGRPGQALGPECLADLLAGAGTADDPLLVTTAEDLYAVTFFACDWDKRFKLTADIDLAGYDGKGPHPAFRVIGGPGEDINGNRFSGTPFTGVFDGSGHAISNLYRAGTGEGHVGLFGHVEDAEIRNLSLVGPIVSASVDDQTGSLIGHLASGTLANCHVIGGRIRGGRHVGALVGDLGSGTMIDCGASGTEVFGDGSVGGLVGYSGGRIVGCHTNVRVDGGENVGGLAGLSFGDITTSDAVGTTSGRMNIGGIVGYNYGDVSSSWSEGTVKGQYDVGGIAGTSGDSRGSRIAESYSVASVTGADSVGGLVGVNGARTNYDCPGSIWRCYCTGAVSGASNVGGLIGVQEIGTTEASFWDIETSGLIISAAGAGETTVRMSDPNTFRAVGWDFCGPVDGPHDIWAMPEAGGYPLLWWQASPAPALPAFAGGTGEPNDPYLLSTAEELNNIGHNPRLMNAHFVLVDDVDLAGTAFFPIGAPLFPFAGVFEGNGYAVSNLALRSEREDCVGLFGLVDGPTAAIRNLAVLDPNIDAGMGAQVGALAGGIEKGIVVNCHVTGGGISGGYQVGGLVGLSRSAAIIESHADSVVVGNNEVGGLAGFCGGDILQCHSGGLVSGGEMVGGLVGYPWYAVLTDCYSTADVAGEHWVGGLVGLSQGWISRCYAAGPVVGNSRTGGFFGECWFAGAESSFWDIDTAGQTVGSGYPSQLDGLLGLPTALMQTRQAYLDAGWDFVGETVNGVDEIWWIDEGRDYPRLWWEAAEQDPADEDL